MSQQELNPNLIARQETKRIAMVHIHELLQLDSALQTAFEKLAQEEVGIEMFEAKLEDILETKGEFLSEIGLKVVLDAGSYFDEEPRERQLAYVIDESTLFLKFLRSLDPEDIKRTKGGSDMLEGVIKSLADVNGSTYEDYEDDNKTIIDGIIELHRAAPEIIAESKRLDPEKEKGSIWKAGETLSESIEAAKGGYKREYHWMHYAGLLDGMHIHPEIDIEDKEKINIPLYQKRLHTDLENIKIVLANPKMKELFGKRIKDIALERIQRDKNHITSSINSFHLILNTDDSRKIYSIMNKFTDDVFALEVD